MRILFAADGSKYTKKALAFLVTHKEFSSSEDELIVLHVQGQLTPRVTTMLGASTVHTYHSEESAKVLEPISTFLKRHKITFRTSWVVGNAGEEIVNAATSEKAHMIVMGTHGHGFFGRVVMGSVAQRVVTDATIPVLLVK